MKKFVIIEEPNLDEGIVSYMLAPVENSDKHFKVTKGQFDQNYIVNAADPTTCYLHDDALPF